MNKHDIIYALQVLDEYNWKIVEPWGSDLHALRKKAYRLADRDVTAQICSRDAHTTRVVETISPGLDSIQDYRCPSCEESVDIHGEWIGTCDNTAGWSEHGKCEECGACDCDLSC